MTMHMNWDGPPSREQLEFDFSDYDLLNNVNTRLLWTETPSQAEAQEIVDKLSIALAGSRNGNIGDLVRRLYFNRLRSYDITVQAV